MPYHLLKSEGLWQFREQGSSEALFTADTKAEAIHLLDDYMEERDGDVIVHKADGVIQRRLSFDSDSDSGSDSGGSRQSGSGGTSAATWGIIGVAAVAAASAATMLLFYRDSLGAARRRFFG